MSVDVTHRLDPLVTADHVDSSWLCRAARALDDLDQCLETVATEVPVPAPDEAPAERRSPRLARAASGPAPAPLREIRRFCSPSGEYHQ